MGVGLTALLTADLSRWRSLTDKAVPELSRWEWQCLSHILSGIEAYDILTGMDGIMSPGRIVAELDAWADDAIDEDTMRAGALRAKVLTWSPLAIAGILHVLRSEAARQLAATARAGARTSPSAA